MINPTVIIAEAGVNHNGSISTAKKLVEEASKAGANFIKFQTFKTEEVLTKNAPKASYQVKNTVKNESQYEMIKRLELDYEDHKELIKHCKKNNIEFLSTAFDLDSIDMLNQFNIPFFKIPSGEITNFPYLKHIGKIRKPVVMSTGMASLDEIQEALNVLISSGLTKKDVTILHCNSEYPTDYMDVNLNAMLTIKEKFDVKVGYSDHTLGIQIPIAAVALGASVIEKHFTLNREMPGPDQSASLEPKGLKAMVENIRCIEISMGDGIKKASKSEMKNMSVIRKSLVAKRQIKVGELFSEKNLTTKRPGNGISPMRWHDIIGKKSTANYEPDDLIVFKEE